MKEILFKPFQKYPESKLLVFGIVITLLGTCVASFNNARFDGVLDVHFSDGVTMKQSFVDLLIDLLSLMCLLLIVAKIINKKTRFIDILVTVLVARTPIYLLTLFNMTGSLNGSTRKMIENAADNIFVLSGLTTLELVLLILVSIFSILITVWYVALLYNGYKTASNAKGQKPILYFAVTLLLAEITSKILLSISI